jgi:type I restriction enzyme M protein
MFYNTGIATYIWVLSNRKPPARQGKVQLIDATQYFSKLRKNLGEKNCELRPEHIEAITDLFLKSAETPDSKLFDNEDFGYWKITVERPLRLTTHVTAERLAAYAATGAEPRLIELARRLRDLTGGEPQHDWNAVQAQLEAAAKREFFPLKKTDLKTLCAAFTERDELAEPVIVREAREGIQYEADPDLRDTESVPLKERIEDYFAREVLPYAPDAWINHEKTVKGYEFSFTRYFYQFQPLRSLEEITDDILALERETEGLLHRIVADTEVSQ